MFFFYIFRYKTRNKSERKNVRDQLILYFKLKINTHNYYKWGFPSSPEKRINYRMKKKSGRLLFNFLWRTLRIITSKFPERI